MSEWTEVTKYEDDPPKFGVFGPDRHWSLYEGMIAGGRSGGADHAAGVPAEAALRLLAAEASDRLGWKWTYEDGPAWAGGYPVPGASFAVEDRGLSWRLYVFRDVGTGTDRPGVRFSLDSMVHGMLTPDELLACLHGKFLLEAATKESL